MGEGISLGAGEIIMSSVSYVTGNKTKVYKCNKNIRFIYHEDNLPLSDNELLQINEFWNELVQAGLL